MKVLDRSWKNCRRMWRWISENLPEKFLEFGCEEKKKCIDRMKNKWLKDHKFTKPIMNNCFFCEYDKRHGNTCFSCPATKIDKSFHCGGNETSWRFNPVEFYHRILVLDAIRKGE